MEAHTKVTSVFRARGWEKSDEFVYIGLPGYAGQQLGYFGKPWSCLKHPLGWEVGFTAYMSQRMDDDPIYAGAIAALHGKVLVCFCKGAKGIEDKPCHGDILARMAEVLYHGME